MVEPWSLDIDLNRPILKLVTFAISFGKLVLTLSWNLLGNVPKVIKFIFKVVMVVLVWLSMSHQLIPMAIVGFIDKIESKLNSMIEDEENSNTKSQSTLLLNALHNNKLSLK